MAKSMRTSNGHLSWLLLVVAALLLVVGGVWGADEVDNNNQTNNNKKKGDGGLLVCTNRGEVNGLLQQEGYPKFTAICPDDIVPGMRKLIEDFSNSLAELEPQWKAQTEAGTVSWASIMDQTEILMAPLEYAWGVVKHLLNVANSPELREAHDTIQPEMIQAASKIGSNQVVYDALVSLHDTPATWEGLDDIQKRILNVTIRDMAHSGVGMEEEKKKRYEEIALRLSKLSTKFSNNVLDSTKAFTLTINDKAQLDGLPAMYYSLYAQNAVQRGYAEATAEAGPWIITLDAPSYVPAMQFIKDRDLRQNLYLASNHKASQGTTDNTDVIKELLTLKRELANMLGFASYADMSLTSKMARNVETVEDLIEMLRQKSYEPAKKELANIREFAASKGVKEELEPWDITFWSERLKEEKFEVKQDDLRPYFSLSSVLDGMFKLAHRLFGVTIVPADGEAETWHKDVRFFHVVDDATGGQVASFFVDPFSRPENKKGGAWMGTGINRSDVLKRTPLAYVNCNGSPPVPGTPSLMRFGEVQTLFHEFGHALQAMLTEVPYGQASGTQGIEWDAVELPSQFMENWVYDKPTLDEFAKHYETGEVLPQDLFDKINKLKTNNAGLSMLRALYLSELDMRLYSSYDPTDPNKTIFDVQDEVATKYTVMPQIPDDRHLCSFSHIFSGGYSAGYYSYKWAEVMSADAFEAFEEVGLDHEDKVEEVGGRFRHTVLAMGGGTAPQQVFEEFRGRQPTPDALLRQTGLVASSPPPKKQLRGNKTIPNHNKPGKAKPHSRLL